MKSRLFPRRGHPVLTLVVMVSLWAGFRLIVWDAPILSQTAPAEKSAGVEMDLKRPRPPLSPFRRRDDSGDLLPHRSRAKTQFSPNASALFESYAAQNIPMREAALLAPYAGIGDEAVEPADVGGAQPIAMPGSPFAPPLQPEERSKGDRWSLDLWAFWRQNSSASPLLSSRLPGYGGGQFGAIMRYSLAPQSPHKPDAFVRAYHAPDAGGESEISVGLSARPLREVPLRLHGEVRALDTPQDDEIRSAIYVTTEISLKDLPLGLTGEAYGQAGLVTGKRQTGFADGQISLTHQIKEAKSVQFSLGAAMTGGVQKGASRLDFGPVARADMTIADQPVRLMVEWRERVAGNARPGSGVAVTLSSRF